MVHSESSGDARHGLSSENSGRTLTEFEGASRSVPAGQPADPDPDDGVSGSTRESQLIPRSIPRGSHGHPTGEKSLRDMTDEEVYAREAARSVDTVARNLERLAGRLRELAKRYDSLSRSTNVTTLKFGAVGVAAEVVNEYTQSVGSNGTHIWQIIRAAQDLDEYRRDAAAGKDVS